MGGGVEVRDVEVFRVLRLRVARSATLRSGRTGIELVRAHPAVSQEPFARPEATSRRERNSGSMAYAQIDLGGRPAVSQERSRRARQNDICYQEAPVILSRRRRIGRGHQNFDVHSRRPSPLRFLRGKLLPRTPLIFGIDVPRSSRSRAMSSARATSK